MKQKLLLMLIALVLISNPTSAQDAKEAFHNYASFKDLQGERGVDDEFMDDIRYYVFSELLPSMDSNSIAFVDTLFKYIDYVKSFGEDREQSIALARQARRIVLTLEGKTPRYVKSIEYELSAISIRSYNASETDITHARQLLGELIDYYHQYSRPTDNNYLNALQQLYYCVFCTDICPNPTNDSKNYNLYEDWAYKYGEAAFVWKDLLTWDDITKEEYNNICYNYVVYTPNGNQCMAMYIKSNTYCESFYSNRFLNIQAYLELAQAHLQLLQRTGDERYYSEAPDIIDIMQWKACAYMLAHNGEKDPGHWIDYACIHSKALTEATPIDADIDSISIIKLHLVDAACRMSVEGYTPNIQSDLNRLYTLCEQGIKENKKQKKYGTKEQRKQNIEDPLYEWAAIVLMMQAEGELLNGNGKDAVKLQQQACKMADQYSLTVNEEIAVNYYAILNMIAIAARDKKTVDNLKMTGHAWISSKFWHTVDECQYSPYQYHLEQLLLQNAEEIFGDKISRDYAIRINVLKCEKVWQLIKEENNPHHDDKDGAKNSAHSMSIHDYPYANAYIPIREHKIKIGNLFYILDDSDMTARVTTPEKKSEEENMYDDEEDEEYEEEYFEPYDIKNVTIPSYVTHNDTKYRVTELDDAFYGNSTLQSIKIPATITYIDYNAFDGCTNLKKITVASNNHDYRSVDGVLFSKDMTTLLRFPSGKKGNYDIPNGVKMIGGFEGCCISALTIPKSAKTIYEKAFMGAKSLTKVTWNAKDCYGYGGGPVLPPTVSSLTFGDKVTYIPSDLCLYNKYLTSVTIPASVTWIGQNAFGDSIRSVIWNAKNCEDFESDEEVPFYTIRAQITSFVFGESVEHIPAHLCSVMNNLSSVSIPQNVTSIGDFAFWACDSLHSVDIPASITHIGMGALSACDLLKEINVAPDNQTYCSYDGILLDKEQTTIIQFPAGKESFVHPNSITKIGDFAYSWCGNLTQPVIDDAVTDIGYAAFRGCPSLQSIVLPRFLERIDAMAFCNLSNLESVTCLAETPPTMETVFFDDDEIYGVFFDINNEGTDIPLYVPAASVEAYRNAEQWKDFKNILPISDK